MAENKPKYDLQTFIRLISKAAPYRLIFIGAGILAVIVAPLGALRAFYINKMVDGPIAQADFISIRNYALLLFGILFVEVFLQYLFVYSTSWLGQSVIRDLRVKVFKHLLSLKVNYYDKTPIGQLTTRTINDIESINQVFSQGVMSIIAQLLSLTAVLGMMFYTSWRLSLVVLISFPLLIGGTYWFKEAVRQSYQRVRSHISRMNSFLQERISGMRVVQYFNIEDQERERFKEFNRGYTQAYLDSIFYYAIFFPFVELMSAVSLGLMVWYGTRGVLDETITLGVLIAFPLYISMLFRPIRMLADRFNTLQMGLVASERVFNIIDNTSVINDEGTEVKEVFEGDIKFENVHFSYDNKTKVLKDINFHIKPKETMAIIGGTGSGKTTIINLLNRFYDIDDGSIKIDDKDIREYTIESLRSKMAIVLQDVFLFTGTVYENITLRDDSIPREKVIEASKIIGAHEFIGEMPGNYDYKITERGNNLSMGQRQLIAFVRALVFNPDILILDEATSSIDTETEMVIQHAIETLIEKRTSIIIAHRLSTIRHADHILVMDKGVVADWGPHSELIAKEESIYRGLYEKQFIESAQES